MSVPSTLVATSRRLPRATGRRVPPSISPPNSPEHRNNRAGLSVESSSSHDDENTVVPGRPDLSYAHLAALAIDASGKKRCTVGEIYSWIETHYPFYKSGCPWWKNCIRHNLSMKRSFIRIKSEGINMWAINPSHYEELLHSKRRRAAGSTTTPVANVALGPNMAPQGSAISLSITAIHTPSTTPVVSPQKIFLTPTPIVNTVVESSPKKRPASPRAPKSPRKVKRSLNGQAAEPVTTTSAPKETLITSLRAPVEDIFLLSDCRSPSPNLFNHLMPPTRPGTWNTYGGFTPLCGAAPTQRGLFSSTPETNDRFLIDNWFSMDFEQPC